MPVFARRIRFECWPSNVPKSRTITIRYTKRKTKPISFELFFVYYVLDLQKLCSTLANVNLCELAEDDDRSSSTASAAAASSSTTHAQVHQSEYEHSQTPPSQYNSTMISGRAHLNELQKENREPTIANSLTTTSRSPLGSHSSSPSVLSNTMPIYENYRVQ